MAQLRKALSDGHLFILAGQSQGTWQVGEKGERWLRENHYAIPDENEYVDIDAGTFSYLKDSEYIYTLGIEYDHNGMDANLEVKKALARAIKGLPILLHAKEEQASTWELYLDLSALPEEVWDELRSHQTELLTATNAIPVSRRQLFYNNDCLLHIYPFPRAYEIYSTKSDNSKRLLLQAPETPGLNENWQGNIFLERATQIGSWQRRLPDSTATFSGELLWLAKIECKPDWPGQTTKVGSAKFGWQLWRFTVNERAPTSWETIQNWFKYRSIEVIPVRQRLEIASPPYTVAEDGQYIFEPGKPIWITCYPPDIQMQGLLRDIALAAEQLVYTLSDPNPASKSVSISSPADRVNYFRWSAEHSGDYRIRILRDASAEPLRVKVAPLPPVQPAWFRGLSCTVTSGEDQQTLAAFNENDEPSDASYILDQLTQEELARLDWTYEPIGVPISITWTTTTTGSHQRPGGVYLAQSAEDLTWYWNEKICPALSSDTQVKVMLGAGSFGSITITVALPKAPKDEAPLSDEQPIESLLPLPESCDTDVVEVQVQVESTLQINEQLIAQFAWFSRIIAGKYGQKPLPAPMPPHLRNRLLELSSRQGVTPAFHNMLEQLASANLLPSWVLFQLQALVAEIDDIHEHTHL